MTLLRLVSRHMSVEVKIPAVGESITSGVVSVWHKKSGERVRKGEPLFTLETDKVSTEIVADVDGVLETKAAEGQEVKIGEVVAEIDESAPVSSAASQSRKETGTERSVKERTSRFRPRCVASSKKRNSIPRRLLAREKTGA